MLFRSLLGLAMASAHVLIFPLPAAGHVNASAALAQKLVSSGFFFVTFACARHRLFDPRAGNKLAQLKHSHIRVVDLEDSLSSLEYSHIDDGVDSVAILKVILLRIREPFERTMVELMASSSPPVCLISDSVTYTRELAEKFQIPWYAFFPMAARELAFQLYVPHLHSQARLPLNLKKSENEGESALATGSQHFIHVPGLPPWNFRQCNNFILDTCWKELQQRFLHTCHEIHNARGILVNTFDELEAEAMDALRTPIINPNRLPIYSLGPLLSSNVINVSNSEAVQSEAKSSPQSEDSEYCLQWLSSRPSSSVIYISFGSIAIPSLDQISELACGLEATKKSFIWVVRPPRGTTADDEISKGFEIAKVVPEGFQARTADRGLVVSSWVPQQRILAHPSTAGFFTHCGWNSTMESIYFGVPTIALPEFYDQMTNCKILVEQLGMGVEARRGAKGIVCREEVERVVGLLRDGEEGARMREKAKQWSKAAKRAFGSAHGSSSSSSKSLEVFLRDLSTFEQPKAGVC